MKKEEIEAIVKEAFPDLSIKVKLVSKATLGDWAAAIHIDKNERLLLLNRIEFTKKCEKEDQLVIILHELGHVPNDEIKSVVLDEYLAQLWAIKKAEEKNWSEVKTRLIQDIISWGEFTWNESNGKFRRYIMASKKFKKEFQDDKTRSHSTTKIRAHASTVVRKNRKRSL